MPDFPTQDQIRTWYQTAVEQAATLRSIANPYRLTILMTLFASENSNYSSPLYFTKLCTLYGIDEGLMTYHLRKLERAGFITKRNPETVENFYRVYSIENKGKKLLTSLGLDQLVLDKTTSANQSGANVESDPK